METIKLHQGTLVTGALVVLAGVTLIAGLKFAQNLAAPIVLGLVVAVVLSPTVKKLSRFGVPRAVSASVALLITAAMLILILSYLGPVITALMDEVPRIQREVRDWIEATVGTLRGMEQIERQISAGGQDAIEAAMPGLVDALLLAPNFAAQVMIFAGTLFFFLLTRDEIYGHFSAQKDDLIAADRAVSHYFVTITLINAGLGFAVFAMTTALGLSNSVLWGTAAFLLNFVLYLGPISLIFALLIAGLSQFSGIMTIVPPLGFFLLNLAEAQFVTPAFVGQRLKINPLGVFLAIIFGLWLWGPVGGIVSLPVMIWLGAFLHFRQSGVAGQDAIPSPHRAA